MKFKITIVLLIISHFIFGQDKLNYELTKESDTLYYFRYARPIIEN